MSRANLVRHCAFTCIAAAGWNSMPRIWQAERVDVPDVIRLDVAEIFESEARDGW